MGLKLGQTNNLKGRPKGVPNKITKDTKELIHKLIKKKLPQLIRDWDKLDTDKQGDLLVKILAYVIPKKNSTEIEALPDEQLDQIINQIFNHGK